VGYDWNRILSGLVALGLVGLAVATGDPGAVIVMLIYLVWPIAMIWWPEWLGSMTGYRLGMLNQASAAWIVCSLGWVLLIGIVLAVVFYLPYLASQAS
jgi:hypothetical protein